ncbi:MAG: tetratricopeptide repeat protein [Acidobacteriota bacterium]
MTERNREDHILQRALEKGLITEAQLHNSETVAYRAETLSQQATRWGHRIASLLDQGYLNEETLEALAKEIENEPADLNRTDSIEATTIRFGASEFSLTLPLSRSLRSAQAKAFPVEKWDRYEFIELIGEGGIGRVYKAKDLRLRRNVALKFLRRDDPVQVERLFHEAQAQARIQHDHICKVYEVSEVEGHPYIAMQYIDGQSLDRAREHMTLEEKVKAIKEIAEALHAAHRIGLIHRDIKPANIMVEHGEDGRWRPYVMDFGLVREIESKGQTVTGMVMGTPSYMSPEQARGEVHQLDCHTDIYSLGATLYALLSGRPPFEGTAIVKFIMKAGEDDLEPQSLRTFNYSISADLETIVMKCLEKDPQRRYDSAKALAEDLQRYLDGEPIQARPVTWTYRITKKAKKNRTLVIVLALTIVLTIVLAAMGLQARRTAAEQARLAQQFGQEFGQRVQEIEGIMRFASLLPLHDTRRERAMIKLRIQGIENQLSQIGPVGQGPAHYAIGRGYLTLQEYQLAREHLQKARQLGYQSREVNYALGQTMGALYLKALEETQRIAAREVRERRIREIEGEYKEPALTYLKASNGVRTDSPAYVEGLIAFYEKRYDEALSKAIQAFQEVPWLYEARKLEGDIYLMLGNEKQSRGDYPGALANYQRAGDAYREAMAIGESDATVYEGECTRYINIIETKQQQGGDLKELFEQALIACDRALEANSESSQAYNKKSLAYLYQAEYQLLHGEDIKLSLVKAIEMGEQSIRFSPRFSNAYNNVGVAYQTQGDYELDRGMDPRSSFDRATEYYRKALQFDPNFSYTYNNLGNLYESRGEYEFGQGIDPRASLDLAIENYQQTIRLSPDSSYSYSNLGVAYKTRAIYEMEQGLDPRDALKRAIESHEKSLQLNPNNAYAYSNLGLACENMGEYEMLNERDPQPFLQRAIDAFGKAIELNPNIAPPYNNLGIAFTAIGQYQLEHGADPTKALDSARTALQKAIRIQPNHNEMYLRMGQLELVAARAAQRRGQDPKPYFEKSAAQLQQSLRFNPGNLDVYQELADLYHERAQWLMQQPAKAASEIGQGRENIDKVLSINDQLPSAMVIKGALLLDEARITTEVGRRRALVSGAKSLINQALQRNALLQHKYGALLQQAEQLSQAE